jgi:hypothetical protein
MVNGILVNNAAITNGPAASRGTYVGTTRSNASSQIDFILGGVAAGGTAGFIGIWNAYNRVWISPFSSDSTGSWTYNSATVRAMNASNGNRVSFVCGLQEENIDVSLTVSCLLASGTGDYGPGIALDSTTTFMANGYNNGQAAVTIHLRYPIAPQLGFHYVQAVETQYSTASVATAIAVVGGSQSQILSARLRG